MDEAKQGEDPVCLIEKDVDNWEAAFWARKPGFQPWLDVLEPPEV